MPNYFTIPGFLSHLKIDARGYPIPFFVAIVDGVPDFRLLDTHKQKICIEQHKCAICGRKLVKNVYYFISGYLGAKNEVSTDPAMHRECAEFSLAACPHMYFQKAQRREKNLPEGAQTDVPYQLMDKPDAVFLVYADKYKATKQPEGGTLIKYRAVRIAGYVYRDGVLTAAPI